jgi:hypothetical protein
MYLECTVKNVIYFPIPSRDVTNQTLIIPGQGEFGYRFSDIRAGDGKIANLFLQCG